jgi:hypothetical protein
MRALCGAIITAGALIGLGLAAVGLGLRYQSFSYYKPNVEPPEPQWVEFRHIDTTLMVVVVAGLGCLVVGLGIAFLGLAYHHHRRHHELLHMHRPPQERTTA